MRDFVTKIDNNETEAGVVVADEYNSIFTEAKGAVSAFLALNPADNTQLLKAMDIASKANFYADGGTANAVVLTRGATTSSTETFFNGLTVKFIPANANTGATTLKLKALTAKPLKYKGADLPADFLNTTSIFIATYDLANDWFECMAQAGGSKQQPMKVKNATADDEASSFGQLKGFVPAGTVVTVATAVVPTGFLECDGSAISRTAYADLFASLGTLYGVGDGSTTFNLPDFRGEFLRGYDNGRGIDSGRGIGTAQGDAIRDITGTLVSLFTFNDVFNTGYATGAISVSNIGFVDSNISGGSGTQDHSFNMAFDASNVVPTASENRPRNIAVMYCIKY